jgi:hypothetical protein
MAGRRNRRRIGRRIRRRRGSRSKESRLEMNAGEHHSSEPYRILRYTGAGSSGEQGKEEDQETEREEDQETEREQDQETEMEDEQGIDAGNEHIVLSCPPEP